MSLLVPDALAWSVPVPEVPAWLKKYLPADPPLPRNWQTWYKPLPSPRLKPTEPVVPFVFGTSPSLPLDPWIPAPREHKGCLVPAWECNEFTTPDYNLPAPPSHAPIRFEWHREEEEIKAAFAKRYTHHPLHPDRAACFFRRTAIVDAQAAALKVFNDAVAELLTDNYLAAWNDTTVTQAVQSVTYAPLGGWGSTSPWSTSTSWKSSGWATGGWGTGGAWGAPAWPLDGPYHPMRGRARRNVPVICQLFLPLRKEITAPTIPIVDHELVVGTKILDARISTQKLLELGHCSGIFEVDMYTINHDLIAIFPKL
ncbi:hypothetical protein C8R45DRAFT_1115649 [Mycena sanguinolenta]|nr:hypothetical protein C8R45DRAFT_1115649 [Mycena sanguinolenta]